MGFSRQEYWSGVPLLSPEDSVRSINYDTEQVKGHLIFMCPPSILNIHVSIECSKFLLLLNTLYENLFYGTIFS